MIFFLVSGNTCSRISGIVGGIAMSRADMESATPECQSLRTTDELPEELPAVIYTLRGDAIRLISARRATPSEIRTYES